MRRIAWARTWRCAFPASCRCTSRVSHSAASRDLVGRSVCNRMRLVATAMSTHTHMQTGGCVVRDGCYWGCEVRTPCITTWSASRSAWWPGCLTTRPHHAMRRLLFSGREPSDTGWRRPPAPAPQQRGRRGQPPPRHRTLRAQRRRARRRVTDLTVRCVAVCSMHSRLSARQLLRISPPALWPCILLALPRVTAAKRLTAAARGRPFGRPLSCEPTLQQYQRPNITATTLTT